MSLCVWLSERWHWVDNAVIHPPRLPRERTNSIIVQMSGCGAGASAGRCWLQPSSWWRARSRQQVHVWCVVYVTCVWESKVKWRTSIRAFVFMCVCELVLACDVMRWGLFLGHDVFVVSVCVCVCLDACTILCMCVTHCMSQHSHTVEKWPHPNFLITWYLPLNKSPIFTGWYPPERDKETHKEKMKVTCDCFAITRQWHEIH